MSGRQRLTAEWPDWVWWILASTVGGISGFALAMAILDLLGTRARPALAGIVVYALFWMGIGTGQWFVLRRRVPSAGYWIAASAAGGVLTSAGIVIWPNPPNVVVGLIGITALLGLLQWLVLRRSVRQAGWWVLASPVGYGLGFLVVQALDSVLVGASVPETAGLVIGSGIASGTAAFVTGGVLVWLLSRTPPGHHVQERAEVRAQRKPG